MASSRCSVRPCAYIAVSSLTQRIADLLGSAAFSIVQKDIQGNITVRHKRIAAMSRSCGHLESTHTVRRPPDAEQDARGARQARVGHRKGACRDPAARISFGFHCDCELRLTYLRSRRSARRPRA